MFHVCLTDEVATAAAAQFLRAQLATIDAKDAAPKVEVEASCVALGAIDNIEEVGTHVLTNSHSEDVCVTA